MSTSYSIERDLNELAKMGDVLGSYIVKDELYFSIGGMYGGGDLPQLTIGAFLLRMRRLSYFRDELTGTQAATLDKAIAQYDDMRKEWAVHYEQKINLEILSRLKMMEAFFRECRESMRSCVSAYPVEAQRRTIVQELMIGLNNDNLDTSQVNAPLHMTDGELRRFVRAGDFIWDPKLKPVYPKDTFWWLYGQPDANEV